MFTRVKMSAEEEINRSVYATGVRWVLTKSGPDRIGSDWQNPDWIGPD